MTTVFITGTAGFIGYHLANELLGHGYRVVGYDGLTDYYDVELKKHRHRMLSAHPGFQAHVAMLEDADALGQAICDAKPDVIVHLAAQAGVRYSLENPRAYIDANLIGTFNVIEQARTMQVGHLLMASTSSVYGGNTVMPFNEGQNTDTPLTLYAATKKANEHMAHAYAHLWDIPTTMFRFFTVYGTWGRPDLALFKFVKAALAGEPIDVYNNGQMARDFTHVIDLVRAIRLLIGTPPVLGADPIDHDTLSPVAPYRVVNIGAGQRVPLMDFITALEDALGQKIKKNMMGMQMGDVPGTWANTDLLHALTGFRPETGITEGITEFVSWYRDCHGAPEAAIEPA
ncbi:UDP-glucuronate 4-epimerase [Cognatiyoonia koreensis]|uniref:UDP-glucuronate 4-epimerase n=1 Tax=Cognatiyoonia koreensis TaxID=364200 RepID=A0A1I0RQ62_9RHOB|nr:NAD-dependent epimerase/dehydratase family protein [Cognatiyoonia koreensis]SEW43492.1 UDP-glucuronate 4-epimerase [Cognatiyoonia koreensis]